MLHRDSDMRLLRMDSPFCVQICGDRLARYSLLPMRKCLRIPKVRLCSLKKVFVDSWKIISIVIATPPVVSAAPASVFIVRICVSCVWIAVVWVWPVIVWFCAPVDRAEHRTYGNACKESPMSAMISGQMGCAKSEECGNEKE